MRAPTILMCPPDFYGIEYEINPWMNRARPADRDVASVQWEGLRKLLDEAGAKTVTMPPVQGLPDLVFTANAGLVFGRRLILSRFRHDVRQQEVPYDEAWFHASGFDCETLPDEIFFEGAGDALFCGDTLLAGYRLRSDARGHQRLGQLLGVRVLPLELIDPYYYHLDTCFCPLNATTAIYFPPAFDDYARRALATAVPRLIEVEAEEAQRFACNAVVVGQRVVMNSGCPHLQASLTAEGFETFETPLDEFVKSGGSAKCLTLRLDGEEAASWKRTIPAARLWRGLESA